jgi:hypothetical protein
MVWLSMGLTLDRDIKLFEFSPSFICNALLVDVSGTIFLSGLIFSYFFFGT